MFVEFDALTSESKIWIFQASRKFTLSEQSRISEYLKEFTQTWESHGKPLQASFRIYYDQIIILAVDESYTMASGCSIDKSVELLKQLEERVEVSLLDRSLVAFQKDQNLETVAFNQLPGLVKNNEITPETLILNNSISSINDMKENWVIPAKESWISKYFNN